MDDLRDDQMDGLVGQEKAIPDLSKARGFAGVPCLCCGAGETVFVRLDEVTTFACSECDSEWTAADALAAVQVWSRVLRWIAAAPTLD